MNNQAMLEKINRYIDSQRENILKTLKRYINFKTINLEMLLEGEKSEIKECQEWLHGEIKGLNFFDKLDIYEIQKNNPNIAAVKKGSGKGKSLLFNSHTDVVRVSEEQKKAWTGLSPFDGGVKDGKVWGRGSSDMKGGGTASLYAVKAIRELAIDLKGDLLLTFCGSEESGRAAEGIWSLLDRGYSADCAIFAEPTHLDIFYKTRGELYFDIDIEGKSTHICNRNLTVWPQRSAAEQVGVNAIDKMLKILEAFRELERSWGLRYYDPDIGPGTTTLAVAMVRAGESFSTQAGEAHISIASMIDSNASVEEIKGQIIQAIEFVADQDHWLREHRPKYKIPFPPKVAINIPTNDPFIQALKLSYRQVMGKEPTLKPGPFVGDANYFYEKGVKSIYYGPGDVGCCHGTNEYIEVSEVLEAAKIYAAMIINWCAQ